MHIANSKPLAAAYVIEGATKERKAQDGGVSVKRRKLTSGGFTQEVGDEANFECALDRLFGEDPLKGALAGTQGSRKDRVEVARSRKSAGMRLRRLFIDAGLVPVHAQNLQPRVGGGAGEELTDDQDRARSSYNAIIRALGPWANIAAGPCCYDGYSENPGWLSNVRISLDKLCEFFDGNTLPTRAKNLTPG